MLRNALLAALAVLLVGPASASALTPTTPSPIEPQLRKAGWQVVLPSAAELARADAGTVLRVSVRPRVRRSAPRGAVVRVALVRIGADGAARGAVTQRRLRAGRIAFTVPTGGGARYELRLTTRGTTHRIPFTTLKRAGDGTAPVPAPATPPVPPTPPTPPKGSCSPLSRADPARVAAALTLRSTQIRNGRSLYLTIAHTGTGGCIETGYGASYERLVDGSWTPVDYSQPVPAMLVLLEPGRTLSFPWDVPDATLMPPGRYRVGVSVRAQGDPRPHEQSQIRLTAEFDVLRPTDPEPIP